MSADCESVLTRAYPIKDGKTPWDLAQENEEAEGTKGYWALNDAQYN